jgi:1,2-dihydroxy-3-keto-5-methylthiopentene dioxygenase
MALVRILEEDRTIREREAITSYLQSCGIDYERWEPTKTVAINAPAEEILNAYSSEIETLKARGGYVTADVIDVTPETPGLEPMLAKFSREHWHDEDEVRFIVAGRGLFHIHPKDRSVVAIEVEAGDLIRVPRGTLHWFNLCDERRIRAIRLFQAMAGWTPYYTDSGVDQSHLPLCLGVADFPLANAHR